MKLPLILSFYAIQAKNFQLKKFLTLLEKIPKDSEEFLVANVFLTVMLLEFIINLPDMLRNIICEIREIPSKKPGTFSKN